MENKDGKIQLQTKESQIGDVYESTIKDMQKMMNHVNIKRIQHMEFEQDKKETIVTN